MFEDAIAWSGTADAWTKMAREFLTVNGFLISPKRVLTRVSFGIKRLPLVAEPTESSKSEEVAEYHIKTARNQADAIRVRSSFINLHPFSLS